jgi:hypothetical protein|tara:strand:- start:2374 stop:2736 length:363 start_codon:yes stop_codon:yes gene_type:complete
MSILQYTFNFSDVNISAQVGDTVYFTTGGALLGGFDEVDVGNTSVLGPITAINGTQITVQYDDTIVLVTPVVGDFFTFVKDKRVNTSSLIGYYASVNFVNDSRGKVELFSVGSDITESSK